MLNKQDKAYLRLQKTISKWGIIFMLGAIIIGQIVKHNFQNLIIQILEVSLFYLIWRIFDKGIEKKLINESKSEKSIIH